MMLNMKPSRVIRTNMLRTMIFTKTLLFFSIGSTLALQWEDGGLWMHSVIQAIPIEHSRMPKPHTAGTNEQW